MEFSFMQVGWRRCLDFGDDLGEDLGALLIKSSGGAGPMKLRQPDSIFGWDC